MNIFSSKVVMITILKANVKSLNSLMYFVQYLDVSVFRTFFWMLRFKEYEDEMASI